MARSCIPIWCGDASMMARRGVLRVLAGGAAFVLSGCGLIWPSDRMRHRITVEVDTPQGVRTGHSVVETEVHKGKSWGDASGTSFDLKGEAVAVELPGGRTLFALLRGGSDTQGDAADYQTGLLYRAIRAGAVPNVAVSVAYMEGIQARAIVKAAQLTLDLPPSLYPMLVTFTDMADPKSVVKVDPADMAASFGAGVTLKRITVQVTDEAVTSGIGKRFSWWQRFEAYDFKTDGPFYKNFPSEVMALRNK